MLILRQNAWKGVVGIRLSTFGEVRRLRKRLAFAASRKCLSSAGRQRLSITVTHCEVTSWSGYWRTRSQSLNEKRRSVQGSRPRGDQRTICAASRTSGRPCPLHNLPRSAAQIARSSPTRLNCAAVAVGFRPRPGPRRFAAASSAPIPPTLRFRSTSRVPGLRPKPRRTKVSAAARLRLSDAAEARWKKAKAAGKTTLQLLEGSRGAHPILRRRPYFVVHE